MGNLLSMLAQWFPPTSKWTVDEIPDLSGKVTIVTGGNIGIGKETVRALLAHNAKVYMASRNEEKARSAIKELREETGRDALFLQLDLSSLVSVRAAAEEFLSKEPELHVLFNNAGVMWPPVEQLSTDGYDLQFGTNVIGHYHLTQLLMPALLAGAQSSQERQARVITTSSSGHYLGKLQWETFASGSARLKIPTTDLYNQSKYGNVVVARELARRYGDKGIVSISLNPGNIDTGLLRHIPRFLNRIISFVFLYPASQGALTQLWAGTAPEAAECNGKFLVPWARVGTPLASTQDPDVGLRLWTWLEEQVKGR